MDPVNVSVDNVGVGVVGDVVEDPPHAPATTTTRTARTENIPRRSFA
jgi:hypothetical protein